MSEQYTSQEYYESNRKTEWLTSEELKIKKEEAKRKLEEKDKKIQEILDKAKEINFDDNESIINWLADFQLETSSVKFTEIEEEKVKEILELFKKHWYETDKQINTWKDFKKYDSDNYTQYLVSLWMSNLKNHGLPWVPIDWIKKWKSIHWKDAKKYKKLLAKIKWIF